jgi:cell division protein ZipA
MELGVRDWMIIVGVLLIVVVLLDGYRRMRNDRRGNIRISLNKQFLNSVEDGDELTSSELPSGGARTVDRRNGVYGDGDSPSLGDGNLTGSGLDFDQPVPMLMESVAEQHTAAMDSAEDDDFDDNPEDAFDPLFSKRRKSESMESHSEVASQQATASLDADSEAEQNVDIDVADDFMDESPARSQWAIENQEVVVINVAAKNEPFKGPDLLHILLACDLRFGNKNIFHRHEEANGRGAVQFSMANSVEPGIFDLDTIDDFTTPGVCFFMSVPGPKESIKAFECMVETAQCLVSNLQGELLDDSRSAMTNQTLEHCRLRLQEFERRQLTQHA